MHHGAPRQPTLLGTFSSAMNYRGNFHSFKNKNIYMKWIGSIIYGPGKEISEAHLRML